MGVILTLLGSITCLKHCMSLFMTTKFTSFISQTTPVAFQMITMLSHDPGVSDCIVDENVRVDYSEVASEDFNCLTSAVLHLHALS